MATLCGNEIPKTIYNSTANKMLVVMQTDSSVESKGFSAVFKTVNNFEIKKKFFVIQRHLIIDYVI